MNPKKVLVVNSGNSKIGKKLVNNELKNKIDLNSPYTIMR